MGLRDDIATLQARYKAGQNAGQRLAEAYAEMVGRKNSKRLIWAWFDDLATLMKELGRYDELVKAANGVDPAVLGAWDCQDAVASWLAKQ